MVPYLIGFRVWVWGFGFGVWGLGFRVSDQCFYSEDRAQIACSVVSFHFGFETLCSCAIASARRDCTHGPVTGLTKQALDVKTSLNLNRPAQKAQRTAWLMQIPPHNRL